MGLFLRRGYAPSLWTPLGDIDVGSIIKLNESGSPVEFYVAKHDYESSLNGAGRTLVVRKDCYDMRAFSTSDNAYANSALDTFLNGTYKGLLDADVQSAMWTTKFYYTPGNGNTTVGTLERAVFQLSLTELGKTESYANTEGSALPIASTLQIAYRNGSACAQWTRTPYTVYTNYVYGLSTSGGAKDHNFLSSFGSRPAFTLPATFKLTDDMLV